MDLETEREVGWDIVLVRYVVCVVYIEGKYEFEESTSVKLSYQFQNPTD